ncbi:MAG: endonuclease/exonuclease/phosphatase family protein [Pirellulales bacterium]|nr:endonuclease/exonuclease/phosphatase family protein [Pirellulales bacterium]
MQRASLFSSRNVYRLSAMVYAAVALIWTTGSATLGEEQGDSQAVKIMTFNLRYANTTDGENRWTNRKEMVADVIRRFEPDFLGTQEALVEQVAYLREQFDGFDCLYRTREADPAEGESCALFYRKARWELDAKRHGTFWLSETPDAPGSGSWQTACVRVCTWGRFVDRQSGAAVWVYNTHLDHQSEEARREGAKLVARRMAERGADEPVVLMGDFNAGESSRPIRHLTEKDSGAPLTLADTFRVAHPEAKPAGTFNGFLGTADGEKIDYILVLPGTKVTAASIVRDHRDGRYPSDHFPVTAEIVPPR